jgi:hypothetical protein
MFEFLAVASKIGLDLLDKSSGSPAGAGNMLPTSSSKGKGAEME